MSTNDYNVISITPDFLTGAPWHLYGFLPSWADPDPSQFGALVSSIQERATSFERLEVADCISSYGKPYISSRKNVLVVAQTSSTDDRQWQWNEPLIPQRPVFFSSSGMPKGSIVGIYPNPAPGPKSQHNPYDWLCDFPGSFPLCFAQIDMGIRKELIVHGRNISHCLSERVEETCIMELNLAVLAFVVFCNIGEITSIVFVVFVITDPPLVTLGDAIASFLEKRDVYTPSVCLLARSGLDTRRSLEQLVSMGPVPWKPRKILWCQAASSKQWLASIVL